MPCEKKLTVKDNWLLVTKNWLFLTDDSTSCEKFLELSFDRSQGLIRTAPDYSFKWILRMHKIRSNNTLDHQEGPLPKLGAGLDNPWNSTNHHFQKFFSRRTLMWIMIDLINRTYRQFWLSCTRSNTFGWVLRQWELISDIQPVG